MIELIVSKEKFMRIILLIGLCCIALSSNAVVGSDPDATTIVKQAIDAVGGENKLLRLFRARETVNVSSDPEKKVPERVSIYEPPKYWWTGKSERVKNEAKPDEPATFLVWAWTLTILTDPASKLEVLSEIVESERRSSVYASVVPLTHPWISISTSPKVVWFESIGEATYIASAIGRSTMG